MCVGLETALEGMQAVRKREHEGPNEEMREEGEGIGMELEGEPSSAEEEAREESEVEVLQKELALLEGQLADMRDRYIRSVADLDNARKRARRAIGEARKHAVAGVLLELLAVVDDFERALEAQRQSPAAETRAMQEGVELIYRQLVGLLERHAVKPIEALGERFDPNRHEAVAQIPTDDEEKDGTVVVEMRRGYMCGEEVLRHSRVGVGMHGGKA